MLQRPTETGSATEQERMKGLLERHTGMTLHRELERNLPAVYAQASLSRGLSRADFLGGLERGDRACIAALIDFAVVGETYFLRHPEHFDFLTSVLAKEVGDGRGMRIWSAGCSSGEEAWSIALSLQLAGRSCDQILATDLSERALAKARLGRYGRWSFRRVSPDVLPRFFSTEEGFERVRDVLRPGVVFRRHSLVAEPPPGLHFDVIFCRNVLIYFEGEALRRAVRCLFEALSDTGTLIVGPSELPQVLHCEAGFERVEQGGLTFARKRRAPASRAPNHLPPAEARRSQPAAPAASPTPVPAVSPEEWEVAARAAQEGRWDEAEQLAWALGSAALQPRGYLLAAALAEQREDFPRALEALRRAIYLSPENPVAHAQLMAVHRRRGEAAAEERARMNALKLLEVLPDSHPLEAVEQMTAGALRRALKGIEG